MPRFILCLLIAILMVPENVGMSAPLAGPTTTRTSRRDARRIVERGLAAFGGTTGLDALHDVSRHMEGFRVDIGQSWKPDSEYTRQTVSIASILEPKTGRLFEEISSGVLGGGVAHSMTIAKDRNNVSSIDASHSTIGPGSLTSTGFAKHIPTMFRYPELLLPYALNRPSTLRLIGARTANGTLRDVISFSDAGGIVYNLEFDRASGRLDSLSWLTDDITYSISGHLRRELVYSDYRNVGTFRTPFRFTVKYGGELLEDLKVTELKTNVHPPDATFEVPQGLSARVRPTNFIDINKLGNDVYFVRAPYNSVFVVFDDYVLVIEAGLDDSQTQEVIAAIKKTVPGEPIRYVVPTHFHHDHIGGLRGYVAEGATIVTTESIRGEVEKLVAAPYTLRPDTLALHSAPLKVETFTQKRVFKDGSHSVEIHNIGPNPHAADFVIAFIPSVKVLYEADALDLFQGNLVPGRPESWIYDKRRSNS